MSDETATLIRSLAPEIQPYAVHFVNALRNAGVPATIISARRSAATNREVGGADRSRHLYGLAFDLQIVGYQRAEIPWWWWQVLGNYWEAMGGRWGGRFDRADVNHFDSGTPL